MVIRIEWPVYSHLHPFIVLPMMCLAAAAAFFYLVYYFDNLYS